MPHSCRRDCGSRPVVGSSRNSRSGSPASAQAIDETLLLAAGELDDPAAALGFEFDECEQLVDGLAAVVERSEKPEGFLDRQLVGELRLLELHAEALPQLSLVGLPVVAKHLDVATIGREQPFEDLDRRRLAGAVRTEQTEALAATHLERQAVDCDDVAVAFLQILASHCKFHVAQFSMQSAIRVRLLTAVPDTVLVAAPEHLPALQEQGDFGDALAFSDADALKALEAITRDRPKVIALETQFAATSRGAALIKRIKADPKLRNMRESASSRTRGDSEEFSPVRPRRYGGAETCGGARSISEARDALNA